MKFPNRWYVRDVYLTVHRDDEKVPLAKKDRPYFSLGPNK